MLFLELVYCWSDSLFPHRWSTASASPLPVALIVLPIQPLSPISRFQVNDTIETLVNHSFIDSWSNITSYERYYNACALIHCSFSYRKRLDVLYVVSTFLGGFSGLPTGLRFLSPHVLRAAHKFYDRLENRWLMKREGRNIPANLLSFSSKHATFIFFVRIN